MPVPVGTLVHVKTSDDMVLMAAARKLSAIGVVGRDFWKSWRSADGGRWETEALPIDWYREWISVRKKKTPASDAVLRTGDRI